MGVFCEFLQARLGGTKYDVKTWDTKPEKKKSKKQIIEEQIEHDEKRFKMFATYCTEHVNKFKSFLDAIENDELIVDQFHTKKYMKIALKFRDEFLKQILSNKQK